MAVHHGAASSTVVRAPLLLFDTTLVKLIMLSEGCETREVYAGWAWIRPLEVCGSLFSVYSQTEAP